MWKAASTLDLRAGARRRCRPAALLCCAAAPWCGTRRPPRPAAALSRRATPPAEPARPAALTCGPSCQIHEKRTCTFRISAEVGSDGDNYAGFGRSSNPDRSTCATGGCNAVPAAWMFHAQPTAHSMLATAGPPPAAPNAAVSVRGSASSDMRYVPAHRAAARTAAVISLWGRQSTCVGMWILHNQVPVKHLVCPSSPLGGFAP